jgi:hypothetical protein
MIDMVPNAERTAAIRQLNDNLRRTGEGGRTVLTRGLLALPTDELAMALRAVANFDAFRGANDPYGEHDCAVLSAAGHQIMWKIDYYDPELEHHSLDPADASITSRVLTIMLAEEY